MMPTSEHWWNYLTPAQRDFISSRIKISDSLGVSISMRNWLRNREGWPEFSESDMHSSDHWKQNPLL